MKVIGITGGIGCGKSEVLRFLEDQGAYVIEADKLAHSLMSKGQKAYDNIVDEFGRGILSEDGEIDRGKFSRLVFQDEALLARLNDIVHPEVKEYIINDINDKRTAGTIDYYIIEAALLIQDGYKDICDEMWYVYADVDTRLSRLVKGRGGEASKYLSVMDNQDDEDYYRLHSDEVIDNSGDFENTQNVLKALLNKSR
ncbi:MAG: dephospho-CoA kinase [Lachnospiraceae bacterium]|nr:dephospho-CoA kinase [Lachnospiraceae bacterium]